jgi:uncharacterized protein YecT (DUF1311 family)
MIFDPDESRKSMSASHRLAALALAIACLAPAAADATDNDGVQALSRGATELGLCGEDGGPAMTAPCKQYKLDALATQIEKALSAALAKSSATARPLLKRDQVWFDEMIINAAETMAQGDDAKAREAFVAMLRQRIATLEGVAQGFGRHGIAGRWVDTFGVLEVTASDGGAYRVAIDMNSVYGTEDEQRRQCRAIALLSPESTGWLAGKIAADDSRPAPASGEKATPDPTKFPVIKIRRQGETLRVTVYDTRNWEDPKLPGCDFTGQITASYFASGKADAATAAKETNDDGFVAPTFDCARPITATDEEICADPVLAKNDQRLNRAWKTLLPRLDPATRRALIEDQRGWVGAQGKQYLEFLHPAWNKTAYFVHFTGGARDDVERLQRERIALLEGFDENRKGFAGVWLAYNAILEVKSEDGGLSSKGWKWEQGDWKAGCDYDINGEVVNGAFQTYEKQKNPALKNPDTLERDHAMLIVNRKDDSFASKRNGSDDSDEAKCKRRLDNSSTARLFPVRPSADIDNPSGAIR